MKEYIVLGDEEINMLKHNEEVVVFLSGPTNGPVFVISEEKFNKEILKELIEGRN